MAQVQPRYIVLDLSGRGLRRRLGPPPPAAGVPPDAPAMALDQAHHRTRRSGAEDDLATSRPMIQSGAAMARSVRAETSGADADADAVYGAGTSGSEAAVEEESEDEADSFDASFCQEGFARKIEALAQLVGMDGACEPVAVLSEVVRVLRSIDTHRHSEYIPCASD